MSSKRTILLIDYDPQSIQKTLAPLQRAGYQVEVAGDGVSGLEAFDKLGPDLVLIEPMVPKKHGFQVCQQIKSTTRGKRTPVLITTAFYKGRKHRLEAQQKYGCDGYLEKPIAEDLLLSTCRQFLIDLPPQAPALPDAPSSSSAAPSVISFPDLPLGEERKPVVFAALDDLSDDEIQARLDRMLLEDAPEPAALAVEPAAVVPVLVAPARLAPPARVEPAPSPAAEPEPTIPLAQASAAALARQPARARPAVLDRPRVRATEAAATRVPSGLPLWIGVVAVLCLIAGGALLWLLPGSEGSSTDVVRSAPEPHPARALQTPTQLPEPEVAEAAEPRAEALAAPSPSSEPVSAPTLATPSQAAPKPLETTHGAPLEPRARLPQAPARVTPIPTPQAKPAAAAEPESAPEPPDAEAGAVSGTLEPPVAPSLEPDAQGDAPALPREGDLLPLAEVDVAPRPTSKPAPDYPRAARELRQEGTVFLRVLVTETGAVEQIEVESGTNFRQLREAAMRAVRGWRYEPALEQGVRVRVWITEQVTFQL